MTAREQGRYNFGIVVEVRWRIGFLLDGGKVAAWGGIANMAPRMSLGGRGSSDA